jgi:alpha-L-fucosidase
MASKFGPNQLYRAEDIVNEIADALVHAGFEMGVSADEQHWDGKDMGDMSGVLDRLREQEVQMRSAIGLVHAYEIARLSRQVIA